MNTHAGYSKKTLTDLSVLLAGGGDKALSQFLGSIQYNSASHKLTQTTVDGTTSDVVTLVMTDENVKQTPKTDNVNRPLMMINGGTAAGELTNTSIFSTGIYANAYTKMVIANGFVKAGSDSSHVLLGDGNHKALSDFAMASDYVKKTGDTMSGPLTIDNKLYVNKGINVRERSYFNGGVEFNYPLYIHDTLYVYDNSIFEGSATFNNPTHHYSTGYFYSGINVSSHSNFSSGVDFDGSVNISDLYVNDISKFEGSATFYSGINVSSHSYFNSGVDFYESININHKAHIYDYIDYPISNSNNKTINTILFTATDNDYVRKMSFSTFGAKLRDSGFLDSRYVSAVTISGIHLRVTKNGSNTDLTIPYAINTDTVDGLHASNLVKLYSYSIPASKGVRITFSPHNSCIINCSRGNNGGQLVLIGTGYGEEGTIRNRFTELVSCNESYFLWSLPQVSDISTSVEIMHVSISGSAATVYVHSSGTVTFTEISELTSPKMNNTLLNSLNYTNYTVKKDGTGASGTWGIDISGTATNANYINTVSTESSSNHYLTFVDSNNSSAAYEALYTNSDLYYKPNSHKLYINKLHTSSEIEVNGTARLYNDVKCSASFEVQGTSRIKGELYVTSTAHFQANIDAYDIYPHTKNTYDLGAPNKYWKELFVGGDSNESGSGHIWYGKNWGSGKEYNFGIDGLILYLDVDETSGIQLNGDYINMWSPCDDDYSLRYWDTDRGEEAWHIDDLGNFSGSASKLTTARTIWGQSFNGTANVSGSMSNVGNISFSASGKNIGSILYFDTTNSRLGVGTSSPAYKLHVIGDIFTTTGFKKQNSSDSYVLLGGGGHKLESNLNVASANKLNITGYNSDGLSFNQISNAFQGSASGWAHYIIANHGNGSSYYNYILRLPFWGAPQYSRKEGGVDTQWFNFATEENFEDIFSKCNHRFTQHEQGSWTRILQFTIPNNSLSSTISFKWHPTETARDIWADFNINIRENDINFYAVYHSSGTRILKCVGNGTTFSVWVQGDKSGWDPFGLLQIIAQYGIDTYTTELAYQDSEPNDTYNKYAIIKDEVPIGTILMWCSTTVPNGYLVCNGQTFDVTTYPELYALLGTNVVPDLTDRFIVGAGNRYPIGQTGGEETHKLTIAEMPKHSHSVNVSGSVDDNGDPGTLVETSNIEPYNEVTVGITSVVGGSQPHNNMPPYYALTFIIRATNNTSIISPNYLQGGYFTTVVTTGGGNIKWTGTSGNALLYSKNGGSWSTASSSITLSVNAGDKILWKGITSPTNYGIGKFSGNTNVRYSVEGNIMSLLHGDDFVGKTSLIGKDYAFLQLFYGNYYITSAEKLLLPATTLSQYCYYQMFYGCTNLTTAPKLPATTLAQSCYQEMFYGCRNLIIVPELQATTLADSCYRYMFGSCTNLVTAPELPATTLTNNCYNSMFYGCLNLTTAPVLPATTLASSCYYGMFQGCTSLTTAPKLPATTLAQDCYRYMFSGCTKLSYIKCLATNISATNCTYEWVSSVAAHGTFIKASGMNSWAWGASGIPNDWSNIMA